MRSLTPRPCLVLRSVATNASCTTPSALTPELRLCPSYCAHLHSLCANHSQLTGGIAWAYERAICLGTRPTRFLLSSKQRFLYCYDPTTVRCGVGIAAGLLSRIGPPCAYAHCICTAYLTGRGVRVAGWTAGAPDLAVRIGNGSDACVVPSPVSQCPPPIPCEDPHGICTAYLTGRCVCMGNACGRSPFSSPRLASAC